MSNGASIDDGSTFHYKVLTKSHKITRDDDTIYILELLDCRWELCVWLVHGVEGETSYSPGPKEKKCNKISGLSWALWENQECYNLTCNWIIELYSTHATLNIFIIWVLWTSCTISIKYNLSYIKVYIYWKYIYSMQLNVIALQLGCQRRFLMQISINNLMFKWFFTHPSTKKIH